MQVESAAEKKVLNRVMVVDDDATTCELIQEILASAGMDCVVLTDSRKAASQVTLEKFDAIFMDERMPFLDGVGLATQVRSSGMNKSTPIVMITGDEDRRLMGRAFGAGVNFFLFKPIDRHRLLHLIRVTEDSIQREARRFQRIRVTCKVLIEWASQQINGTTLDLSLGGTFVQASGIPPMGSSVIVKLDLKPGKPPIRLAARVVRIASADCMGLQFEGSGSPDHKALQEFLLPLVLSEGQ
jgi:CheY-like chemotaxis protein